VAKIGIIGYGFVGKAVEYGFKPNNEIFIYDISLPSTSLDEVVGQSDFIFICVPTPMTKDYTKTDLSIVEEVFKNTVERVRKFHREPIMVLKSTIVPGTTRGLAQENSWTKTLFNPEFLTEDNYLKDFVNADRIVIGGDCDETRLQLVELYRVSFPETPIFQTDPTSAEMVKYMANTYLATKVIFANEMWELCEKLGIKYEEVKNMVVADKRIYNSHLDVTTERGFGKKCFPKDTVAILGLAKELGVKLSVIEAAWKKNLKIRKVRDWEDIPGAVSK
jgi:UDPglucose 6-dehydrogenase